MMNARVTPDAGQYYAELAADYPTTIRQLVPQYDDMLDSLLDLVLAGKPRRVLDVGTGPGTVAAKILERDSSVHVTALDASGPMVDAARSRLAAYGNRATLVHADVTKFAAGDRFDVVCSNLALHNIPYPDKPGVLRAIHQHLVPRGMLVWGDFVRHEDIAIQEHVVRFRIDFAREAGCPRRIIEWTFRKEANDDAPLSVGETLDLLAQTGFQSAAPVWLHDAFLIVWART